MRQKRDEPTTSERVPVHRAVMYILGRFGVTSSGQEVSRKRGRRPQTQGKVYQVLLTLLRKPVSRHQRGLRVRLWAR